MGGKIPVFDRGQRLTLIRRAADGSIVPAASAPVVVVRRVGKSADNDVMMAVPRGMLGTQLKYIELRTRLAIVGAERLTPAADPGGGGLVEFAREQHPHLGMLASVDVWDVIDEEDIAMITVVAAGDDAADVYARALKRARGDAEPDAGGGTPGAEPGGDPAKN